jgi:hypothetical protein
VPDLDLDALGSQPATRSPSVRKPATVAEISTPEPQHLKAPEQHAKEHGEHAEPGEHGDEAHEAHAAGHHGHKHGKHGHGDHGGHGDKWLVTYCDMITLLIAFFICILTFASKENGNKSHARLRDSLVYGPGGTGAAGDKSASADSIVWRQVLASVSAQSVGSSTAPRHSDPHMHLNEQVLDMLDNATETILDDNFSFRVPLVVLMSDDKAFSPAGKRLLGNIAFSLRQFPFDLIVQIDDPAIFPIAFRLTKQVTELANVAPSRAGISLADNGPRQRNSVRFLFVAQR